MPEEAVEGKAEGVPERKRAARRGTGRSVRSRRPKADGAAGQAPAETIAAPQHDPRTTEASPSGPLQQSVRNEPVVVASPSGESVSTAPGSATEGARPPRRRSSRRRSGPADSAGTQEQPSVEGSADDAPQATAAPAGALPAPSNDEPPAGERRRSRRRPSRSGAGRRQPTEAPPLLNAESAVSSDALAPATSPAPALPETEEDAPGDRPANGTSSPDQAQRGKTARRRRRGSPRRVRTAGVQTESTPLTMLIAAGENRNQIAVLRDRELIEHYVSRDEDRSIVGNIYVGRVQNVLPGMEAAFLDIGEARNAVLYAGEVSFDEEIEGPPPRIESMLKSGQSVLAQVTKDPMGSKGARLTTEVSLAGRYVVLVPGADSMGISRRLPDDERKRLRDIASRVRPAGQGLIVRTAASGVAEGDLEGDINRLVRIWAEIEQKQKNAKPPKLLHSEPDLAIRGIRDLFTNDVVRVVVDRQEVFDEIRDYLTEVAPALAERVEIYEDERPLFDKFQVVEQLRKAIDRKVWLKSGGHIVIDRTEAMTVIDVNTGRFVGKSNLETTVLHANLEAAEEIAKQLRLRDIGGIIVIDFIDMMHERNRQELVRTFEAALQRDKTRTQVFAISDLGLMQMTRKNVSEGLMEAFSHACEACEGRGIILTDLQ